MELLAAAADANDAAAAYPLLDRRARAALNSIVQDRRAAARLIEADYPPAERAAALVHLGDAATAIDAPALFARRCGQACFAELAAQLGAPRRTRPVGLELEVDTQRGATLRFFRDGEGRVGLVWHTAELDHERLRANRELVQISQNAEVYRRRRALDGADTP